MSRLAAGWLWGYRQEMKDHICFLQCFTISFCRWTRDIQPPLDSTEVKQAFLTEKSIPQITFVPRKEQKLVSVGYFCGREICI